jgi:hypothetical protein
MLDYSPRQDVTGTVVTYKLRHEGLNYRYDVADIIRQALLLGRHDRPRVGRYLWG